jgi:hypothetical protein
MKDASYFGQGRMMVHTAYPEDERKKKGILYRMLCGLCGLRSLLSDSYRRYYRR